mgnify:CR=1 FL=1
MVKRLRHYLIGVVLGLMMVIGICGNRDIACTYSPNARVLAHLNRMEMMWPDESLALLAAHRLDTAFVRTFFSRGDVNFDRSQTRGDSCKTFVVEHGTEPYWGTFRNCDSTVVLINLETIE